MKIVYLVIASALILSCSNTPKNIVVVDSFPEKITLIGDSLNNFDNDFAALALYDAGDYILCQLHSDDCFFSVYSKDSLKKKTNLLKKGKGYMEFIAPTYLGQFTTENNDIKIWILEQVQNKYFKINLSKTIRDNKLIVEKEYDITSYNRANYRSMYFLSDSILFGTEDDIRGCKHKLLYPIEGKKHLVTPSVEFHKL